MQYIANMRKGEVDNLPGVGRIGQNFLIASDRSVEANFTDCVAGCADAAAPKHRPVGKNQRRRTAFRQIRGRRLDLRHMNVRRLEGWQHTPH